MQFNSLAFAAFLAVVLPLYFLLGRLGHLRRQNALLLVASYFFYGWWDWRFLGLLAVSTVVDFSVGLAIARRVDRVEGGRGASGSGQGTGRGPKAWLLLSLIVNLGILGVFKYYDFFVESAAAALHGFGLAPNLPLLDVILPVGISFYTFQTIAYTYSVYKGDTPATRDFIAFAVYVAYFPQLVAGPIERARKLLPQIQSPRIVTAGKIRSGCELILLGLFKKIAIADAVAGYVDTVFLDPSVVSSATLILGVYMFALQIYGDFSGYTDIARGVSRVMGIELILNFRQPYLASNITDFWRRWHISLSTWLKEHVYIPLGGNRHGTFAMYRNLMLTMLIGGLWHGAGWTFVIWGGSHGLYLAAHKALLAVNDESPDSPRSVVRRLIGVVMTFHLVCFAWIFFRARSLDGALDVMRGIADMDWRLTEQVPIAALLLLALSFALDGFCEREASAGAVPSLSPGSAGGGLWRRVSGSVFFRGMVYGAAVVMMLLANSTGEVPFIYFQF